MHTEINVSTLKGASKVTTASEIIKNGQRIKLDGRGLYFVESDHEIHRINIPFNLPQTRDPILLPVTIEQGETGLLAVIISQIGDITTRFIHSNKDDWSFANRTSTADLIAYELMPGIRKKGDSDSALFSFGVIGVDYKKLRVVELGLMSSRKDDL